MKISEKQLNALLVVSAQLANTVLAKAFNKKDMMEGALHVSEIIDEIISQQSEELKEIE